MYELMRRMPAREVAYWRAYYRRVPFGPYWDNYRAAVTAYAAASAWGGSAGMKVEDFMPGSEAETNKYPSPEELVLKLNTMVEIANKKAAKRGDG